MLAGVADTTPKSGGGEVEIAKERQGLGCKGSYPSRQPDEVVTAPAELRETLDGLATNALATETALVVCTIPRQRPSTHSARLPAVIRQMLNKEIEDLKAELERLIRMLQAPALVEAFGVGPDTAAALLVAAGSNALIDSRLPSPRCVG